MKHLTVDFMTSLLKLIRTQYAESYDLKMYSDPKIYHGGKYYDLRKLWYVYFSFRNPKKLSSSGIPKLIRQAPIYDNINKQFKTKEGRLKALKKLRDNVQELLDNGYSPYKLESQDRYSIESSLDYALKIKKQKQVKKKTFDDYLSRVKSFKSYLNKFGMLQDPIESINQLIVNDFLEYEMKRTSSGNSNNTRTALSALFTELKRKGFVSINYFQNSERLKHNPEKNKAFTPNQVIEILNYSKKNYFYLWVYFAHIYYALFRPIESVRLTVSNLDLERKMFFSDTKTFEFYKQTPDILIKEYYSKLNFKNYSGKEYLITNEGFPKNWNAKERDRRGLLSKHFSKYIRKEFNLSQDYTVYSFRHAAIGQIFIKKIEEFKDESNVVEKSLSAVRDITGHQTNEAVKKYLREIGYFKIKDWSDLL